MYQFKDEVRECYKAYKALTAFIDSNANCYIIID
jgi:hypothetical protein